MTLPIYQGDHPTTRPSGANRGLWYTRFYTGFSSSWEIDESSKRKWITENADPCGNSRELEAHAERMKRLSDGLGGHWADFETVWHFATGLGISHPVENGFAWHHTLGVPFLAASGVKGLLRGWTKCWRDFDNEEVRQATIARCFGASAGDGDSSAGNLIFFEALPIEPVQLTADVMTPHMGKWYEQGHDIHGPQDYATKAPADWYSPVPVPFLVVKKASFRFMIAPRLTGDEAADTQAHADARDTIQQLKQALEWLGAGAKTAAGYGRMQEDPRAKEREAERRQAQADAARRAEEEAAHQAALAQMSPLEREICEFLDARQDKNQPELSALLVGLKRGQWSGESRTAVAERAKAMMQKAKKWKEKSEKKNPDKDHDHQDTLKVMAWIKGQ